MTAGEPPPRIVEVAFWCWVAAAVLLILFGLLIAAATAPAFFRGAGVIFAVAGGGLAYMAGRTRRRDSRFRRAAVALAVALVVLLLMFAVQVHGPVWALIAIPLLAGVIAATRPAATTWFDSMDSGRDGG
jgi:peptidoglycan/LPS O-acetylase OafA/YrhL